MPGQGGLDRDLCGFDIADLPDHYDVRILAKERSKGGTESEVYRGVDLPLDDAFQAIFDRILDRQHLAFRYVQFGERGVQRCRLAAAGRARHEHDAVRSADSLPHALDQGRIEAERPEVERELGAIEHPHHHALAVDRRRRRHAKVDVMPPHGDPQPSILGKPSFGDVEPGHHLDTGDERRAHGRRHLSRITKDAIDAKSERQTIVARLDMNVRCAFVDRARDKSVDRPDHRRIADQIFQALEIVAIDRHAKRIIAVGRQYAAPVKPVDRTVDVARSRDDPFDRTVENESECRLDKRIERVGHCNADHRVIGHYRQCPDITQELW